MGRIGRIESLGSMVLPFQDMNMGELPSYPQPRIQAGLSLEEVSTLYKSLRYYGHRDAENAIFNVFNRDSTPLLNYWEDEADFLAVYHLFYKIARCCKQSDFVRVFETRQVPQNIGLEGDEHLILVDPNRFLVEAWHLLDFLESMPSFFEYEVKLISLGYPCEPAS